MTFYKHRPWRSTEQLDDPKTQGGKSFDAIRFTVDESSSKHNRKLSAVQHNNNNRPRNSHSHMDSHRVDDVAGYAGGDRQNFRNRNPNSNWRDDFKKNNERSRFSASAVDFPPTRRHPQKWSNSNSRGASGQGMHRSFDQDRNPPQRGSHHSGKGGRPYARRDPHDHSPSKQAHSLGHHPFDVDSSPEDSTDAFEGQSPERRHHRTATIATPLCSSVPEFSTDQSSTLPPNPLASLLGTASGSGRMNKFRPAQLSSLEAGAQSDSSFIRSLGEEQFPNHRRTNSETSLKEEVTKDRSGFRVVDARTSAARPFLPNSSAQGNQPGRANQAKPIKGKGGSGGLNRRMTFDGIEVHEIAKIIATSAQLIILESQDRVDREKQAEAPTTPLVPGATAATATTAFARTPERSNQFLDTTLPKPIVLTDQKSNGSACDTPPSSGFPMVVQDSPDDPTNRAAQDTTPPSDLSLPAGPGRLDASTRSVKLADTLTVDSVSPPNMNSSTLRSQLGKPMSCTELGSLMTPDSSTTRRFDHPMGASIPPMEMLPASQLGSSPPSQQPAGIVGSAGSIGSTTPNLRHSRSPGDANRSISISAIPKPRSIQIRDQNSANSTQKLGRRIEEDITNLILSLCECIRFGDAAPKIFTAALVYLRRIAQSDQGNGESLAIDEKNYLRLCTLAIMLATKMYIEEHVKVNCKFAKATQMDLLELNRLEIEFLHLVDFNLVVREQDFEAMFEAIEGIGLRKGIHIQRSLPSPGSPCSASVYTPLKVKPLSGPNFNSSLTDLPPALASSFGSASQIPVHCSSTSTSHHYNNDHNVHAWRGNTVSPHSASFNQSTSSPKLFTSKFLPEDTSPEGSPRRQNTAQQQDLDNDVDNPYRRRANNQPLPGTDSEELGAPSYPSSKDSCSFFKGRSTNNHKSQGRGTEGAGKQRTSFEDSDEDDDTDIPMLPHFSPPPPLRDKTLLFAGDSDDDSLHAAAQSSNRRLAQLDYERERADFIGSSHTEAHMSYPPGAGGWRTAPMNTTQPVPPPKPQTERRINRELSFGDLSGAATEPDDRHDAPLFQLYGDQADDSDGGTTYPRQMANNRADACPF